MQIQYNRSGYTEASPIKKELGIVLLLCASGLVIFACGLYKSMADGD